ncbi:MAG: hypothetical protein EXS67_03040 [Candidatus Margulisbacteria bacterium]|nr:hypothetical protein [Candidatus Margulisiibacteriota bacterium]
MSTNTNLLIHRSTQYYQEKDYVLRFIFTSVFNIPITLIDSSEPVYRIEMPNGHAIKIKDDFFSRMGDVGPYCIPSNLPQSRYYAHNDFTPETDIPVLYGTDDTKITDHTIETGIDIIASIFFMLTRWEEVANTTRDHHNRFPLKESIAYQWGFSRRPVVNEYIEMLWNMLIHLGITYKRKPQKFELLLTHDVDDIRRWDTPKKFLRSLAGDILVRKNFKYTVSNILSLLKKEKDPYDTFDYIMDISDKYRRTSHFFFMAGGTTIYDRRYDPKDPRVLELIKHIHTRGHKIGIHPSYDTYNNPALFESETSLLRTLTTLSITTGRQHYLRFEVPTTWQQWQDTGFDWESSLGYAEAPGFRAGYCGAFPVYNFITRTELTLLEIPVMIMDVSLSRMSIEDIQPIIDSVKKYQGTLVVLWHNSNFNTLEWRGAKVLYEKIIEITSTKRIA